MFLFFFSKKFFFALRYFLYVYLFYNITRVRLLSDIRRATQIKIMIKILFGQESNHWIFKIDFFVGFGLAFS